MDPVLSTVIVAVITGVFTTITALIGRNQNKLIAEIDEQTIFIEKEKTVRQRLVQAEKDRDGIVEQMTILSMKINILMISALTTLDERMVEDLKVTSNELEAEYKQTSEVIRDINKEYEVLISVSNELQKNYDSIVKRVNKK